VKSCVLLYNPNSGNGKVKDYLSEIEKILSNNGYATMMISTKYKGHAVEIIKELDQVDLVMSFGGDGTFNEVMRGNFLRKEKLLLSHIPVGTTNDVGAMFGYGKNILQNVKMTLTGEIKEMDICMINKTPFIYVAGFGKYIDISYGTSRNLKKRLGYLAYLKEGIRETFNKTKMYDVSYVIDDVEYRGLFSLILVSSANHIAGINNIYSDVKLDDDRFEVLFCNINKKKDLLKSLYFLTRYGISKVPGLYFFRTNNLKIKIHNKGKLCWGIDGEKLSDGDITSYKIENVNNIKVLMPKKNIKKLFINS